MMGLSDRILALLGRRRKGPGVAGWARVDADNVIRGWAVDGADSGRRVEIEVLIDGEPAGQATADRFDAKLVELGHGDGRHAFELLIPAHYWDGAAHKFEAKAAGSDYRLMSRVTAFTVPRSATAPRINIERVGSDGASGTLAGGQYAPDVQLELWSGGLRLPVGETSWRWRGAVAEFKLAWPAETLFLLQPDGQIAAPGMHESGEGLGLIGSYVRLHPELAADGLTVSLQGGLDLPGDAPAIVRVVDGDGLVLASAALQAKAAALPLSSALPESARLELWSGQRRITFLDSGARPSVGPLVRNGQFTSWNGEGPADWSLGAGTTGQRGFYAFPAAADARGGLTGDFVRILLEPGAARRLLVQPLTTWPSVVGAAGQLRLAARASAPAGLKLNLLGPDGDAVHSLPAAVSEMWSWTFAAGALWLDGRAVTHVEVALEEAPVDGLSVDVALVQVGGAPEAREAMFGVPDNLVENGALLDWPRGLLVEGGAGRSECAAGWFIQNRKATAPVRVMASTTGGAFGMAVAAEEVADYCRLEARLHRAALRAGPRLRLQFEAAIPAEAPRAFQGRRPHSVIERLFLLRRGRKATETGFSLSLEVLATVARRVVIGREPQSYSFDVDVSAVGDGDLDDPELFLAFDFNDAFAVLLRDVRLAAAPADASPGGSLELEDPAITVQAATLKGLAGWLSPRVAPPGLRFDPDPDADEPAMRWSPAAHNGGTVEVVVCVHDAADETLACLQSLAVSSSVPHTVRIVDDGSGEDTRGRLLSFIADKPWMRVVTSPENRGYTASANLGVRSSPADWVILLNSDTVVTPGWIEGLLECAASDPSIAFVGPVSNAGSYQSVPELKDRQGRWKVNALPPGWTPRRMADFIASQADKGFPSVPLLNGFCTMIRREAFLALGGFNEAAFPQGYGEENDLCVRATAAGYKLAVADHVYVYHAKSASFGSARRTELQKAAGRALADLHPDVDFTALGDRFREAAPLVNLRARVRALYEEQG